MAKITTDRIMGMPITIEIVDDRATKADLEIFFDYFRYVDATFSTYKPTSEISLINKGKLEPEEYSQDVKKVLALAEKTKLQSHGYFDSEHLGRLDPSGIVKGWAILQVSKKIKSAGFNNYYINAGGDIQTGGLSHRFKKWSIGIRSPFEANKIVQVVYLTNQAIATSGSYARGEHIYNPKTNRPMTDIVSLSVIGKDILEADRFATAAFAMGKKGINFIENQPGLEGYLIDQKKQATFTSGFKALTIATL